MSKLRLKISKLQVDFVILSHILKPSSIILDFILPVTIAVLFSTCHIP